MKSLSHIQSLSELLTVVVADLKAVLSNPKYKLNVKVWHGKEYDSDVCSVCVAGSVMAGTLQSEADLDLSPPCFDRPTTDRLLLINQIRRAPSFYPLTSDYNATFEKSVSTDQIDTLFAGISYPLLEEGSLDQWERLAENAKRLRL